MERKERGFFGKVLVFIFSVFAVIGVIATALSVLSPNVNPKHFVWTAFFGLAFWEILLFDVLVLLALLLLWSRKAWIAVIAMLIAVPGIRKSYSFGNKKAESTDSIRVMSYNVYLFQSVDKNKGKEAVANDIIRIVQEQSPDVLCCQEFCAFRGKISRNDCIRIFSDSIDMPYVYYNKKRNYSGNVIFSKYPLMKAAEGSGFSQEETYGVLVTVDAGEKGKFYLADIHLVSNMITTGEIEKLRKTSEYQQTLDTVGKKVLNKLIHAYVLRSDEVTEMLQGLPPIDRPTILCGDFNDTPLSYTYSQIHKAGFTDTFTKVGRGIKPTYAGKLPLLRIDYIWANDQVRPLNFKRYRVKASDHYPIILDFSIDKSMAKPEMKSIENNLDNTEIQLNNTEII